MQPKFIDLPEKKLVGLGAKFISILSPDKNNDQALPALWQNFIKQSDSIPHKTQVFFGLVEMLPKEEKSHKDELFYIAAAEVTSFDSAPSQMLKRTIPPGRYACFTHKGKLDTLEQTMKFIYTVWLPNSKLKRRNAPDLEFYDHRFNHDSDQSEFDILLPIMPA
jgi:AraC family transcriptional regulator